MSLLRNCLNFDQRRIGHAIFSNSCTTRFWNVNSWKMTCSAYRYFTINNNENGESNQRNTNSDKRKHGYSKIHANKIKNIANVRLKDTNRNRKNNATINQSFPHQKRYESNEEQQHKIYSKYNQHKSGMKESYKTNRKDGFQFQTTNKKLSAYSKDFKRNHWKPERFASRAQLTTSSTEGNEDDHSDRFSNDTEDEDDGDVFGTLYQKQKERQLKLEALQEKYSIQMDPFADNLTIEENIKEEVEENENDDEKEQMSHEDFV